MELSTKLQFMNLKSTFLTGATPLSQSLPAALPPQRRPLSATSTSQKATFVHTPPFRDPRRITSKLNSVAAETYTSTATLREEEDEDIESLFSDYSSERSDVNHKRGNKNPTGASSISSGVRLENVSKSYKGVTVGIS